MIRISIERINQHLPIQKKRPYATSKSFDLKDTQGPLRGLQILQISGDAIKSGEQADRLSLGHRGRPARVEDEPWSDLGGQTPSGAHRPAACRNILPTDEPVASGQGKLVMCRTEEACPV